MPDLVAMRRAFAAFLGDERFRKFVQQRRAHGRLRYWQEQEWSRFIAAHPEFSVDLDELAIALRICHLHGDELQEDTAEVFHGNRDLTQTYVEVRNRLFPRAAQDVVSTEGRSFEGDRIAVWFCPTCQAARAEWSLFRRR